jgi:hypothetical protein
MKRDSIIGAWLERVFRPGDNWRKLIDDRTSTRSNKRGGNGRDSGLDGLLGAVFGATSLGEVLGSNLRGRQEQNTRRQKKSTTSTKKSSRGSTTTKRNTKSTGKKRSR